MKIMRVKQPDGSYVDIPLGKGADGKTAYEYAVEGGYAGTELEFTQALGEIQEVIEQLDTKVPVTRTINNKPLTSDIELKPSDIGALPDDTPIPQYLSDLKADSGHNTVTDAEKNTWNAKSDFSGNYNDLTNKPDIPTIPENVSAFENDAGYLTTKKDIVDVLGADPVTYWIIPSNVNEAKHSYYLGKFNNGATVKFYDSNGYIYDLLEANDEELVFANTEGDAWFAHVLSKNNEWTTRQFKSFSGDYKDLTNKPTETDPTVPAWAKAANKPSYTPDEVGAAPVEHEHTKSQITDFPASMPASDVYAWAKAATKPSYTPNEVGAAPADHVHNYIPIADKGAANGVATLDANGKVPSAQLPSYVDDVLEYDAQSSFPTAGESGKIYVNKTNNKTYRWGGSAYVEISASLALGETSSTAYPGDKGKSAYDHSQMQQGNPHKVSKTDVGLSNVDNVKQYSASNPPPYPVTSVNDKTGAVELSAGDVGAYTKKETDEVVNDLAESVGEVILEMIGDDIPEEGSIPTIRSIAADEAARAVEDKVPTTRKVNEKALSSDITLSAGDVGAAPTTHTHTKSEVGLNNVDNTADTNKPVSTFQQAAIDNAYQKVMSRGEQLVVNGSALMGNNTNFSSWQYDGTVTNNSPGSFTYPSGQKATLATDEFFAINPANNYKLSIDVKSASGRATIYAFFNFYDADKNEIKSPMHIYNSASTTTLARELKAGDTVIYLSDVSGWSTTYSYGMYALVWNYTNSNGYTYPVGTYSRTRLFFPSVNNKLDPSAIDTTNKTVKLKTAYTGATIPAGTAISQSGDGATYKYLVSNKVVPTVWTTYEGSLNGIDLSGTNQPYKAPPGTAYCKIGFLWNNNAAADQIWVTNVTANTGLATVATSGSYNDLTNKPTIPSKLSDLTSDANNRTVTDAEKNRWNARTSIPYDVATEAIQLNYQSTYLKLTIDNLLDNSEYTFYPFELICESSDGMPLSALCTFTIEGNDNVSMVVEQGPNHIVPNYYYNESGNTYLYFNCSGEYLQVYVRGLVEICTGATLEVVSELPEGATEIGIANYVIDTTLADYVKKTDYASDNVGGVARVVKRSFGISITSGGVLTTSEASEADIDGKTDAYKPIVPKNLDYAVKSVTYDKAEIDGKFDALEILKAPDLTNYYTKSETYNKTEVNSAISSAVAGVDLSNYYTKSQTYSKTEVDNAIADASADAKIDVVADVGQTILVKAVGTDGKPTEWEAADHLDPEKILIDGGYILSEVTLETTVEGTERSALIPYFVPKAELKYIVTYNGIDYECECLELDEGYMIGNMRTVGQPIGTDLPFAIIVIRSVAVAAVMIYDSSTTITISVREKGQKQIRESLLPILNITTLVPQTTFTGSYASAFGAYIYNVSVTNRVLSGTTYTVVFDGVEYVCTGKHATLGDMAGVYVGNGVLATGINTGEPFALLSEDGATGIGILCMDANEHTVEVKIKELKEQYTTKVFTAIYGVTTYQEIVDAVNAGRVVQVELDGMRVPLFGMYDGACVFFASSGLEVLYLTVDSDNQWTDDGQYLGLVGTTAEITPSQVAEALEYGRPVTLTHQDPVFGEVVGNSFSITYGVTVACSCIIEHSGTYIAYELEGSLNSDTWSSNFTYVAETEEVAQALENKVSTTRKINGKALSSDITLTASDVGAAPTTHSHTKSEVGLSNVDNTSDANKPVSTAQATAILDAKTNDVSGNAFQRVYASLIPYGTSIPANADLNTVTYMKVGNYYCSKNADAGTLTNSPTTYAFMMTVSSPLSTTIDNENKTWVYRLRKLQDYRGPEYVQYCYTNGTAGNWIYGAWNLVIKSNNTASTSSAGLMSAADKIKLDGYATVKQYGAKGDGTTDDTAAFNAALAAKRVVHVPGGTYKLSGTLVILQNCRLELEQDTVLNFTQTSGNCIEMKSSATLNGNHGILQVPYAFTGNVIYVGTTGDVARDTPPYVHWDPQWKRARYIYDVNIIKPQSNGLCYSNDGACSGNAIRMFCDGNNEVRFIWGALLSGIRIAGAFTYGIDIENVDLAGHPDSAWNHDMRIEAVIQGCETGASLKNCNFAHLAITIQPQLASANDAPYAKWGVRLDDCRGVDMMSSFVWDWQVARTDSEEYKRVALYGNCTGLLLNEYLYWGDIDKNLSDVIYTNYANNWDNITILQEKLFKSKDNQPYFFNGSADIRLTTKEELESHFITDIVPTFTNVLPLATDANGNIYNGTGWSEGYISQNGTWVDTEYYRSTGFIPVKAGDVLYFRNISFDNAIAAGGDIYAKIAFYDANKTFKQFAHSKQFIDNPDLYYCKYEKIEGSMKLTLKNVAEIAAAAAVRLSFRRADFGAEPIISKTPIEYKSQGFLSDDIYFKSENLMLLSPSGKQFKLSVDESGNLKTTAV